jgi:CPA1 family monovalent cation:H+ antiporter
VIFLTILDIATGRSEPSVASVSRFFVQETLGGIALGWLLGWIVFRLLRKIDDYQVEVLLSIALCMGSYALADAIHMSGPIAVVVAGLFLGNNGRNQAMSEQTQEYLGKFWELIDEILNSLLFLLIGHSVRIDRALHQRPDPDQDHEFRCIVPEGHHHTADMGWPARSSLNRAGFPATSRS